MMEVREAAATTHTYYLGGRYQELCRRPRQKRFVVRGVLSGFWLAGFLLGSDVVGIIVGVACVEGGNKPA